MAGRARGEQVVQAVAVGRHRAAKVVRKSLPDSAVTG
jgi:hypothetical protein